MLCYADTCDLVYIIFTLDIMDIVRQALAARGDNGPAATGQHTGGIQAPRPATVSPTLSTTAKRLYEA